MSPAAQRPVVDPGNAGQAENWNGHDGDNWASNADRFDRSVAGYHRVLVKSAEVGPTDDVVDVGCGNGETTRAAAREAAQGSALGVDLSSQMVAVARRRAAEQALANVRFEVADAQVHPFVVASADLVISRFGAMFFADPVAAFTNIDRALRPGGRLCMVVWQGRARQEWTLEILRSLSAGRPLPEPPPDAPGPFTFAEPRRIEAVLGAAGFEEVAVEAVETPLMFGADESDAFSFMIGIGGWMLDDLDEARREHARSALRASVASHLGPDGVTYRSAAWLVTGRRSG